MITAHLPSGYLLGRPLGAKGVVMVAAIAGAVAPDLDMIWFALVDSSIHHHRFWPHIPAICAMLAILATGIAAALHRPSLKLVVAFFAGVFLHLILDTLTGGIMWLWPLNDQLYTAITVPVTQSHWVLSFIFDWTFALEIIIWITAILLWWQDRKMA